MKTITKYTLAVLLLSISTAFTLPFNNENEQKDGSESIVWVLDKAHTNVEFSIKHFFTPVIGRFEKYSTDIRFSPDDLENSSIYVEIPIAGINTQNSKRDEHLKSEDFFNSKKWSNIKFISKEIRRNSENSFVAVGELTIRDVTKTIELPFTLLGIMDHPMMAGTKVAGITASTTINRTDYGVGVGDWAATMVVGDEVIIELNLEFNSQ